MRVSDIVLERSRGYASFKRIIGADRLMRTLVAEYLRPTAGTRILDVGCGYSDVLGHLDGCSYVGIDGNPSYIERAEKTYGDRGRFLVATVADLPALELGQFDLVIAIGLLHHLADDDVTSLMKDLQDVMAPSARFVSLDGVWDPAQRTTARVLAALDRGRHVREAAGYVRLIEPWFAAVDSHMRHDLLPIPYSHCIVTASRQS